MIIHIKRRIGSDLSPSYVKTVGQKLVGLRISKVELERGDLQAMLTEEGLRWTKKHLLPQMTYPIIVD